MNKEMGKAIRNVMNLLNLKSKDNAPFNIIILNEEEVQMFRKGDMPTNFIVPFYEDEEE